MESEKARKGFLLVFTFLALTFPVQALNDINLSIQNSGTGLCISATDLRTQTCNTTSVLTLDGSADHMVYFTYEMPYEGNATALESGLYLFEHGLSYVLAFGSGLFMLAIIFGGMIVFKKVFVG